MNTICYYAIIRFMPFLETEEFANVGLVLFSPQNYYASYKLAPVRFARVSNFFDDLEGRLYADTIAIFNDEMQRVTKLGTGLYGKDQLNFFKEVTRKRESILRFGDLRAIATEEPQQALDELYNHYVGRNFNDKEYREEVMEKILRADLRNNVRTARFTKKQLMGEYNTAINMPFVANVQNFLKVIKPLAFDHDKPINLLEHGEKWINRVKRLLNLQTVEPQNMLFAIESPTKNKNDDLQDAFDVVEKGMRELEVNILPFDDKKAIYQFAKQLQIPDKKPFQLT